MVSQSARELHKASTRCPRGAEGARRGAMHDTAPLICLSSSLDGTRGLSQGVPHAAGPPGGRIDVACCPRAAPLPAPTPHPAGGSPSVRPSVRPGAADEIAAPGLRAATATAAPSARRPRRGARRGSTRSRISAPPALTACSPGACCLNVVESETGGTKAPERHCSGSCPAWMACVPKCAKGRK